MVLGGGRLDDGVPAAEPAAEAAEIDDAPTAYNLELMESIIQRLQPNDRHQIRDMISERARMSGALGMACVLFWWVSVQMGGDSLGDADIPASLIGKFDFHRLSLLVPALVVVATIMTSIGREKGQASTSNVGGILAILALFYILEPIGMMTLTGNVDAQTVAVASGRLATIAVLIHLATKMMIDSLLLEWVRTTMMNMDIDLFPKQQDSGEESHADEAPPLA